MKEIRDFIKSAPPKEWTKASLQTLTLMAMFVLLVILFGVLECCNI
ncbi:MAG: hypothetical protein GX928_06315 [Ruminococcaceae bacterium]|nr:hypothetical protein [Oscillospiraceae bacterium]